MVCSTFGDWLKHHQQAAGLRDEELIEKCRATAPGMTGISASSLSLWRNERGSALPSVGQFLVIARALNLSPGDIFLGLELAFRRDLDRRTSQALAA